MTAKRFYLDENGINDREYEFSILGEDELVDIINGIVDENEQLKQQLNIFEKFLEGNDLDIEWDEFCGVDECAFENPDFSCKECIHLKGDVE